MLAATLLLLIVSQEPADAPAPHAAQPAAEDAGPAPAPARNKSIDEVQAIIRKLPTMSDPDRQSALIELKKKYGDLTASPVLPPPDIDLDRYSKLAQPDQARVSARHFFNDLIAGNTTDLVARSGFPFMLEDRRIERPDDLRNEWAKNLRAKRTDLLNLYDVELLSPADMEKKYGKPPSRLNNWNWRAANTWIAVGNLSGHAAIVVLKQAGLAWQVVAYHD